MGINDKNVANGAGCLAAQLVAHFKTKPGNIYLVPTNAENEEYNYNIYIDDNKIIIKVNEVFEGNVVEFGEWLENAT